MPRRVPLVLVIALLLSSISLAKKKNKQELPDLVLNAETAVVVIHPDAGEPIPNPIANRAAEENVENALTKWGRFHLVKNPQTADLVIAVRKGHAGGPTIKNSPTDNRPVVLQPTDGDPPIGAQQGGRRPGEDPSVPPPLTDPGLGPQDRGPHLSNEMGPSEDSFEVYRGGTEYPLDAAPLWRYMSKNALDAPAVAAVSQFRKVIGESEKQRQESHK
jgi:hypothetical protein